MNLLLPSLEQQITIANELLKFNPSEMRKSQKINLRMILQSINDPKTIGLLTQLCQDQAGTIEEVIALLKTLLTIDCNTLIQCLSLLEPSDHSGLQREERSLLFTIHTQFILFNLTFVSKSIVSAY